MEDWKQLFSRCARWGQERAGWSRSKGHDVTADFLPVTFAPATEEQIAREEARLGVRLPPSLRSFYLHSNGHGTVGNFIWSLPTLDRLGWLRDVEPHLYDIVEDDEAVARCLVVSGKADASWWLLDPGDVDDRGEWRAGRWSSWNPGMRWIARDFFALFEDEVSTAEELLAAEQSPRPVSGAGRPRNESTIGDIHSAVPRQIPTVPEGYVYVPAQGFESTVTISAPARARVGEWVLVNATRRSGPWNLVKQSEVQRYEFNALEPLIFEPEVAGNLWLHADPPGHSKCNSSNVAGTNPEARCVMFDAPGRYTLRGRSAFPLPVDSNIITIQVE